MEQNTDSLTASEAKMSLSIHDRRAVVVNGDEVKIVRLTGVTRGVLNACRQVVIPLPENVEITGFEVDDAQRARLAPYFVRG